MVGASRDLKCLHNPKVCGSNPARATTDVRPMRLRGAPELPSGKLNPRRVVAIRRTILLNLDLGAGVNHLSIPQPGDNPQTDCAQPQQHSLHYARIRPLL